MKVNDHEILLMGIVGSTAYGLAGPESDVDRLGIFAAPTSAYHGLKLPQETHVGTHPDVTIHEARKWCQLAMSCNPTILELVWLPDKFIEVETTWGAELRNIRSCFPTASRVRDAYLGYASQQFKRLKKRNDGSFSSDTRKRTAKHARHLFRLCHQGYGFYATGKLMIELEPLVAQRIRAFGERVADGDIDAATRMIEEYERKFDAVISPLGDRPDESRIELWLRAVRHSQWAEDEDVLEVQRHHAVTHARLLTQGSRESWPVRR